MEIWHEKPFWDVIHKWINVWSSIRKMVAEFKRLRVALDAFVFRLAIYPQEKNLFERDSFVLSSALLSTPPLSTSSSRLISQSPLAPEPKRRDGDRLQPLERWIFLVVFPSRDPSSSNHEHFNSSAALKHHFAIPSSGTYYYLLFFPPCDT